MVEQPDLLLQSAQIFIAYWSDPLKPVPGWYLKAKSPVCTSVPWLGRRATEPLVKVAS